MRTLVVLMTGTIRSWFSVLAIILLAGISLYWQPLRGQSPGVGIKPSHEPKQKTELSASHAQTDQRGTQNSPLVVETHDRPKTREETAEAQRDKDQADSINRWTLLFTGVAAVCTGLLVIVGLFGVKAAVRTLKAIERQAVGLDATLAAQKSAERAWLTILPDSFTLQPSNKFDWMITNADRKSVV